MAEMLAPPTAGPTPGGWSCASSAWTISAPSPICRPSPSKRSAPPQALAPLAAGVVPVTLLAAVPVYFYIVGRSPNGQGAVGMLDRIVRGWPGKTLILVLLGFVATDYVVTRCLSVADAAVHLVHDPFWRRLDLSPPRAVCAFPPTSPSGYPTGSRSS